MMNAKFCLKSTILGTWCCAESLQIVKQNKTPGPVWLPMRCPRTWKPDAAATAAARRRGSELPLPLLRQRKPRSCPGCHLSWKRQQLSGAATKRNRFLRLSREMTDAYTVGTLFQRSHHAHIQWEHVVLATEKKAEAALSIESELTQKVQHLFSQADIVATRVKSTVTLHNFWSKLSISSNKPKGLGILPRHYRPQVHLKTVFWSLGTCKRLTWINWNNLAQNLFTGSFITARDSGVRCITVVILSHFL